jgi:hypothetical protein
LEIERTYPIIYNIDPGDTIHLGIERVKTAATLHEWQTQALAGASSTNSVLEGDDGTTDTATPTVRLGNYHQISDKVAAFLALSAQLSTLGVTTNLTTKSCSRVKNSSVT